MCKDKGVKNVFISGLIPSRKVEEHYISNLNNQLKEISRILYNILGNMQSELLYFYR